MQWQAPPKAPRWLRRSIVQTALKMDWSISCWCSSNQLLVLPHKKLTKAQKNKWTLSSIISLDWAVCPGRSFGHLVQETAPITTSKAELKPVWIHCRSNSNFSFQIQIWMRQSWDAGQGGSPLTQQKRDPSQPSSLCCVMPCLITDAHSTQPSLHRHLQGGKKTTLKGARFGV